MSGAADDPTCDPDWPQLARFVASVSDRVLTLEQVRPDSHLMTDLGLSSLMAVNLVVDLEREFDFIVSEQDFDDIETVGDLLRLVRRKRAGASP